MKVSALTIYPVKSCGGIQLAESPVLRRGLAFDRRFQIVDQNGEFVTQREYPKLARVRTRIEKHMLILETHDGEADVALDHADEGARVRVRIWNDEVDAVPCAPSASELLSEWISHRVRLVYMPNDVERAVDRNHATDADIVSFADGFPILVASEASLADLNAKLEKKITMDRFRPNLVLADTRAFEEDELTTLDIGDAKLSLVKPCSRCVMINVDPLRGVVEREPLAVLASYRTQVRPSDGRKKTYFAMNALVARSGTIRVGDVVR